MSGGYARQCRERLLPGRLKNTPRNSVTQTEQTEERKKKNAKSTTSLPTLDYPDSDLPTVEIRARIALALIAEGAIHRATNELQQFKIDFPNQTGRLEAKQVSGTNCSPVNSNERSKISRRNRAAWPKMANFKHLGRITMRRLLRRMLPAMVVIRLRLAQR